MDLLGTGARIARLPGALAAASVALLVASCGGTDLAGVGSGGTGISVASYGSISGFGSVIVNGVHYDDSAAVLADDDGTAPEALALGMVVEVRGEIDPTGLAGTAAGITVISEARGIVEGSSADGFTLLGLTVRITGSTVFEGTASVGDGDYVEVYGLYDRSNGTLTASRIEPESPGAGFKVRGSVAALDTAAKTFALGSLTVDYSGVDPAPAGLADGAMVRVHASGAPTGGVLKATRIDLVAPLGLDDVSHAEVEGVVDRFVSLSDFSVGGIPVDAGDATFEGGTAADLALGRKVEVEGAVQSGVLVATKIEFEDDEDGTVELKGLITDFVDIGNFEVRATRVDASGIVLYEGGSAADLRSGACVKVKGALQPAPTGSTVLATDIHFESSCD